jgi:hypothetical protein
VDALVLEVPQLLANLVQNLRDGGGTPPWHVAVVRSYTVSDTSRQVTFVQREVHDLRDTFHDFDVVVNCTGLGSRWLCNDPHVRALALQRVAMRFAHTPQRCAPDVPLAWSDCARAAGWLRSNGTHTPMIFETRLPLNTFVCVCVCCAPWRACKAGE